MTDLEPHDAKHNAAHEITDANANTGETAQPAAQSATTPLPRRLAILAAAFAIPFLFDRLWFAAPFSHAGSQWTYWAVLCLAIAAIDLPLFARRAHRTPLWWVTLAAVVALAVWLIAFAPPFEWMGGGANLTYAVLTGPIVLPALLMTLLQLSDGRFDPYRPSALVTAWLRGWAIDPFTHWKPLGRTLREIWARLAGGDRNGTRTGNGNDAGGSRIRRIGLALIIAAGLLLVLVPLLMSADEVFDYAVTRIVGDIDITAVVQHIMLVAVPAPFVFSLIMAVEARGGIPTALQTAAVPHHEPRPRRPFDPLVVAVALGIVLALYAAFCLIQFTFLFAGAGLPAGTTYAEYARSGFFQLLFAASLNLAGFGLVLRFTPRRMPIVAMQAGLLAATGVLLASAFTRLNLYIHVYGLTWLRYASVTFIALLAALLLLALARLFTARIPLVAVGFVMLLVWWIAIGYADPGRVIDWWNASHGLEV